MAAAAAPRLERRRDRRLPIRVPLTLSATARDGRPLQTQAETVEINRFGALLRVPKPLSPGTSIEALNEDSQLSAEFRVVRLSEEKLGGLFEIGVELLSPVRNFWGVHLPELPEPVA